MLDKIVLNCEACKIYASKPRRFKFTLRDDKDFNHSVYIDVFFIDTAPILHVVTRLLVTRQPNGWAK